MIYTSKISEQKPYPKEMGENANKYKNPKPNWPVAPLPPFIVLPFTPRGCRLEIITDKDPRKSDLELL